MARSVRKGPLIDGHLMRKVDALNRHARKTRRPHVVAALAISPEMVGHTFAVHNGRKFIPVFVSEDMVGHKLGEFSPTRMFHGHSGDRKAEVKGAPA